MCFNCCYACAFSPMRTEPCQILRSVVKFARKYHAASYLSAKLFGGEDGVRQCIEDIEASAMRDDEGLKKFLELTPVQMQQWVRHAFMSDPTSSPKLKHWIQIVVRPMMICNIQSVPDRLHDVIVRFTAMLQGDECTEEDAVRLKLAASCLNGDMSAHPLVQGLALQCRRLVLKQKRGITTMAGRRDLESSTESQLIADAGLCLAIHCQNSALVKEFGLSSTTCRINMQELHKNSLPTPALALLWDDVLKHNFVLLDQRYLRCEETPRRFLSKVCNILNGFDVCPCICMPCISLFVQTVTFVCFCMFLFPCFQWFHIA